MAGAVRAAAGHGKGESTLNRKSMPAMRRVGFAAGVAGLAALGGGVASGATLTGSTQQAAPHIATCATSQLRIWYGQPAGGSAGASHIPLEFSNTGTTECALDGFPGVSGVTDAGTQLGSPASWNHIIEPRNVVLAPNGGTAHVLLQITDVSNYPSTICGPTKADGLLVYPPNQKAAVMVPYVFEACSKTGAIYLNVDPVNAGVGIPLYTDS